jgi:polyribonucleotide nucleotidyltransferase
LYVQATGVESTEETIVVPSRHVGAVIGKGGETINSMMKQSGTNIILQKVRPN